MLRRVNLILGWILLSFYGTLHSALVSWLTSKDVDTDHREAVITILLVGVSVEFVLTSVVWCLGGVKLNLHELFSRSKVLRSTAPFLLVFPGVFLLGCILLQTFVYFEKCPTDFFRPFNALLLFLSGFLYLLYVPLALKWTPLHSREDPRLGLSQRMKVEPAAGPSGVSAPPVGGAGRQDRPPLAPVRLGGSSQHRNDPSFYDPPPSYEELFDSRTGKERSSSSRIPPREESFVDAQNPYVLGVLEVTSALSVVALYVGTGLALLLLPALQRPEDSHHKTGAVIFLTRVAIFGLYLLLSNVVSNDGERDWEDIICGPVYRILHMKGLYVAE